MTAPMLLLLLDRVAARGVWAGSGGDDFSWRRSRSSALAIPVGVLAMALASG